MQVLVERPFVDFLVGVRDTVRASMNKATNLPVGFPKGLHVLVVDEEDKLPELEIQLRQPELQYAVTCARNAVEALELLRFATTGNGPIRGQFGSKTSEKITYDIILAEARLVAMEDTTGKAFIDACEDVPVVLMAEHGNAEDVMRAVKLGAVDFLDKPLSMLKLKNIWQHCVRKMMRSNSFVSFGDAATRPCYSAEPVMCGDVGVAIPQPSSISGCVPSSMTAPIIPGGNTGYVCTGIAGYAGVYGSVGNQLNQLADSHVTESNRKKKSHAIDSPQTPSGSDIDPTGESTSAGSALALNNQVGIAAVSTSSHESGEEDGPSTAGSNRKKRHVKRNTPPLSAICQEGRPPMSHGMILPGQQWPPLDAGCTWGTPVGSGSLPPPLPQQATFFNHFTYSNNLQADIIQNADMLGSSGMAHGKLPPESYLMKPSASSISQDSKDGIESGDFFKNISTSAPPLGLKLKKSHSLLNMINEALTH